jgi:metal-responsive CopG/Arc/MetJ family transcriptional regulator
METIYRVKVPGKLKERFNNTCKNQKEKPSKLVRNWIQEYLNENKQLPTLSTPDYEVEPVLKEKISLRISYNLKDDFIRRTEERMTDGSKLIRGWIQEYVDQHKNTSDHN